MSAGGPAWKVFAKHTRLSDPTPELRAFDILRDEFRRPQRLAQYDRTRQLFIDIGASKAIGFGAVAYHSDSHLGDLSTPPGQSTVRPICFLGHLLGGPEQNYWPTELEVTCLV